LTAFPALPGGEEIVLKAPKFGISFSFQAHRGLGEPYDKAYREGLELAAEANRLGYHSVWASEHHFSPDQWNPSPFTFLAAVAALPQPDVRERGWEIYTTTMDAQMRNAIYGYLAESENQAKAAYMREVVVPGMARLLRRPARPPLPRAGCE